MKKKARKGRVTLALVAERAGVSVTTVSVILSGREEWLKQFHPDTIARVRMTAEELGYHANLFATGLPGKGSSLFALVLHDLREDVVGISRLGVYEGALLSGVVRAATQRSLYPVAAAIHGETDDAGLQEVERIIDGGVFGSIVRTPNPLFEKFLRTRMKEGYPVVAVFPSKLTNWPSNAIDVDNEAVGQTMGRLLGGRARKKWLVVQYQKPSFSLKLRADVLNRRAKEENASLHWVRVEANVDESAVCDQIAESQKRVRADGVLAMDNILSVGSLLGCVKLGMRPAEDFDLVGCDCSAWQSVHLPTITCVGISWLEVGAVAVEELAKMQQNGTSSFDSIVLEPRVVPGGTCPVAVDHPAKSS